VSDFNHAELDLPQQIAALREAVEKLDRQVARAGKEQFKATSLAEAQQQNLKAMLDQVRAGEAARERELTQLRAQADREGDAARLAVIVRLLPVLDGLDAVLFTHSHADQDRKSVV
jgi:molecular chaperone GrpE (heat shock protein)